MGNKCWYHFCPLIKNKSNYEKIILSAFFAMAVTLGFSQLQVNLGAGYLNAKGNQLDLGVWGGGVAVKGLIGNNFSIGVGVRAFPKKEGEYNVGNTRILRTNNVFQAYVPIEYLIANKSSTFQPYIGADLGLQHTNTTWADIQGTSSEFVKRGTKRPTFIQLPKLDLILVLVLLSVCLVKFLMD